MDKDKVIFLNSRFTTGNEARVPNASVIEYGEIAINYKTNYETISFKNDNNQLIRLRPTYLIDDIMLGNKITIFYQESEPMVKRNGDIWLIPITTPTP